MAYKFNPLTGKLDDYGPVLTGTGTVSAAADGTAALPGIAFTNDLNTGIYRPGADQVAISTGGTGRLFVDASGRIGLGASPEVGQSAVVGGALLVKQSADTNGYLTLQGSSSYLTASNSLIVSTNSQERLSITSAGLVGIGTATPDANLHLGITPPSTGSTGVIGFGDLGGYRMAEIEGIREDGSYAGSIIFRTQPQASFGFSGQERLRITSAGRVGIGTANPSSTLHIKGSASSPSGIIHLQPDNNTVSNYITFRSATDTTRGYLEYNYASDYLAFATNAQERLRIRADGGVAVNTTVSPLDAGMQFAVGGPIGLLPYTQNVVGTSNVTFRSSLGSASNEDFIKHEITNFNNGANYGTALSFSTRTSTAALERLRITSAGNVGIGTVSPSTALHVVNPTGQALFEGSVQGGITIQKAGTLGINLYSDAAGTLIFYNLNGNQERARIDSSGRLLVGTSTSTSSSGQTAQLQVAGSARITNGLASSIDVGTIAQNATSAIALPRGGMYCLYVDQMNLFALFVATISGGSPGVRLIYSTATDVVAGLTTEPAGGTYLRLWISSNQLQVKNVNAFTGPYHITALATSGAI